MFFKKAFIEKEFQQCEFLNSKLVKDTADDFLPESRLKPRGINQEKKKEICKVLVPFMPAGQAKFWLDMPTTASNPDLSKERDAAEYEFPALFRVIVLVLYLKLWFKSFFNAVFKTVVSIFYCFYDAF